MGLMSNKHKMVYPYYISYTKDKNVILAMVIEQCTLIDCDHIDMTFWSSCRFVSSFTSVFHCLVCNNENNMQNQHEKYTLTL